MAKYVTVLNFTSRFTKEEFIKQAIIWNQSHACQEYVIPNLQWDGRMDVQYGNENCWMKILEYRNKNILAIRFRGKNSQGVIWTADLIANYNESKLGITANRSFANSAATVSLSYVRPANDLERDIANYSVYDFVGKLADEGYLGSDDGIPTTGKPIYVNNNNMDLLRDILDDKIKPCLPVVCVVKAGDDNSIVSNDLLAKNLVGLAHVLIARNVGAEREMFAIFKEKGLEEANGHLITPDGTAFSMALGVPTDPREVAKAIKEKGLPSHMASALTTDLETVRKNNTCFIVDITGRYAITQACQPLYTWDGVNNSLLKDRWQSNRKEKKEAEGFVELYTEDNVDLNEQLQQKDAEIAVLEEEISRLNTLIATQQLHLDIQTEGQYSQSNAGKPLLYRSDAKEAYEGEYREIVLDVLQEKLKSYDGTANETMRYRRADVLQDIINNNEFTGEVEQRKKELKNIFTGYKKMSDKQEAALRKLGYVIISDNTHYKLVYAGDERYTFILPKTSSDGKSAGKNAVAEFINRSL